MRMPAAAEVDGIVAAPQTRVSRHQQGFFALSAKCKSDLTAIAAIPGKCKEVRRFRRGIELSFNHMV